MAIYHQGRWVTAETVYALEHGPEALMKYLRPSPEPERGEALRLFEPDVGKKPTTAELYAQSQRAERAA